MKTKTKAFLTAVSLLIMLAGCDNKSTTALQNEPVEISFSWWGNDARHEYTMQAIKKFEELHPDIKVKCHYCEWSGYQTRNKVQMVSKTESDVMQINYAWLNQYSPDGWGYYNLNLLSQYIDFSNYNEEDLAYGTQNGALNALPIALNTQTIYINKTIYDQYGLEVPKTWDEYFKAAEVMKGEHYPMAMAQKTMFFQVVSYVGQLNGKDFMDNSGRILFNKKDIEQMINFYCDLVKSNVIPQTEYFDKLNISSGEYAGVTAWLSDAESYCKDAEKNGFDMVVADYPTINGNLKNWYAKPATMYAIRNASEHPEEAAILLDYLVNSSEMAEYQQIEKGIPISSSARDYLAKNDRLNGLQYDAFLKMTDFKDKLEPISPYFENEDLFDSFSNSCNEILYEKSDISEQSEILYNIFKNFP